MIHFFRRIRRGLLNRDRAGKYILYAIGEIILVVIGILIALSINNWNENRKRDLRSQNYHLRMVEDLERLDQQSDNLIEQTSKILESITKTVDILERGAIASEAERETVDYAMVWFSRTNYKLPELPTYEEMKSNGELDLIYDVDLRNKLASFANFLAQVDAVVLKLSNAIESDYRIFNRYLRSYVDPQTLEVTYNYDFEPMASDREFVNTFSRLSYHWRGYVYFMQRVNRDGKKLHEQMTDYLGH